VRLRSHLVLLVLAVLVPMVVFSTIVIVAFGRQQRAAVRDGAVETARALMNAIDESLSGSVSKLQALATARSLDRGDLGEFDVEVKRVLASQPDWLTIVLLSPDRRQVVNALRPLGQAPAALPDRGSFETVLATKKSVIGDLTFGPVTGQYDLPVRVPVLRRGTLVYVLTAVIKPASLVPVLARQRIPGDWVGSVFDRKRNIVARTKNIELFLGRPVSTESLEVIVRQSNAQVQLIDDLLDVSRIQVGKMRLDLRQVALPAVIEGALDAVRPAATAKGIRLQPVIDPMVGRVTGDPQRLQQVVWNLLMNSVKFTPKGGRVQVYLQRANSHVEIVVSDDGQGIPGDVLPFVFEPFRQGDSSSTRAHSGLGLGLALVKDLVELHGGTVTAQSDGPGKGATFVVALPLPIAQIPEGRTPRVHPTAASEQPAGVGAVRLDGLRVLAVDDDPDALELATFILGGAGAQVRTCLSAREARSVLREWRPDVLVSDIEMPGEDGYALIRWVRGLPAHEGGRTPAVALTAYGRTEDRVLSLTAGYSMHVPKPVDPGEFTTIIASLAGRAHSAAE
jgi:CheY-like chemotaxis protein